jgi:hypothetical protein
MICSITFADGTRNSTLLIWFVNNGEYRRSPVIIRLSIYEAWHAGDREAGCGLNLRQVWSLAAGTHKLAGT